MISNIVFILFMSCPFGQSQQLQDFQYYPGLFQPTQSYFNTGYSQGQPMYRGIEQGLPMNSRYPVGNPYPNYNGYGSPSQFATMKQPGGMYNGYPGTIQTYDSKKKNIFDCLGDNHCPEFDDKDVEKFLASKGEVDDKSLDELRKKYEAKHPGE